MIKQDPILAIRQKAEEHGSVAAFAREAGLTPSYVHDVLRQRRPVSDKLLNALGLSRVVVKSA